MEQIRIFLASSNDVAEERNTLKDLFSSFNNISYKYGVKITSFMWELESKKFTEDFSPKQSEYNRDLASSDIVFFLFGKRVGKYTREEFDFAYRIFLSAYTSVQILYGTDTCTLNALSS